VYSSSELIGFIKQLMGALYLGDDHHTCCRVPGKKECSCSKIQKRQDYIGNNRRTARIVALSLDCR